MGVKETNFTGKYYLQRYGLENTRFFYNLKGEEEVNSCNSAFEPIGNGKTEDDEFNEEEFDINCTYIITYSVHIRKMEKKEEEEWENS